MIFAKWKLFLNAEITEYQFKLISVKLCEIIKNYMNDEIILIIVINNYFF